MMTRREALLRTALLAGVSAWSVEALFAFKKTRRFQVGACDWSIGKRADITGLEMASKIGLDGLQIDLGELQKGMPLLNKNVQEEYKRAAKKQKIKLGGLAIGELNEIPYKSDPRAEQWVRESIEVAKNLNTPIVLLAFFSKGDLKNDPEGQEVVIERLKKAAPIAEKAGVVLGVESWLSAEEHMRIIEAVGSKNVKVYYDVANSNHMGYDIYQEIRWLGKENICEFHMKENDALLGKGKVNFTEVRNAIDDIGYEGWVHIEGAIPPGAPVYDSYLANNQFIRTIFPESKKA